MAAATAVCTGNRALGKLNANRTLPATANGTAKQRISASNDPPVKSEKRKYKHVAAVHVKQRASCLSEDSQTHTSFVGFRNLMVLILVVSNLRLMIENFKKYGVLICIYCHDYRRQDVIYGCMLYLLVPCHLFVAYIIELAAAQQAKAALARTKKSDPPYVSAVINKEHKVSHALWQLIAMAHGLNATLNLVITTWIVYYYIHHPGIGTLSEIHAIIVWLKTCSYAFTNRDLRHALLTLSDDCLPSLYAACPYPRNITLHNLTYFWWAPTLVYQPVYPKTSQIRWTYVAKRVAEVAGLSIAIWIASAQYAAPLLRNSLDGISHLDTFSTLERLLKLSSISVFCWLAGFFALFQSFLNALAEVMRFADREFYTDWWNTSSVRTYWSTWNKPVYSFMKRHIYYPLVGRGCPPAIAQVLVFVFSGILHELVVGVPTHNILGVAFAGMMLQLPLIAITDGLQKVKGIDGKTTGNMIFWISFCILGQPLAALLYFFAWQAKYGSASAPRLPHVCPPLQHDQYSPHAQGSTFTRCDCDLNLILRLLQLMPSPVLGPTFTLPLDGDDGLRPARTSNIARNEPLTEDRARSFRTLAVEDVRQAVASSGKGEDAIEERKQRQRAVMAATGLDILNRPQTSLSVTQSVGVSGVRDGGNGINQSRKRSRSGSRLPIKSVLSATSEMPQQILHVSRLQQYKGRDTSYHAATKSQSDRQIALLEEKRAELMYWKERKQQRLSNPGYFFGYGYAGYVKVIRKDEDNAEKMEWYNLGNERTDGMPQIIYPEHRKHIGGRTTRRLRMSRKDRLMQGEQMEELVPIRLDIEFDKLKLRDTFTWNLNDRTVTPRIFAQTLVEDFRLSVDQRDVLVHQVETAIQEQVQDFYPHVYDNEPPLDAHLPYFAYKNNELRILLKLNITIGQHTLVDQFEWDINSADNNAEDFARQMAADLSLSGEFTTAIAHSIREQCQQFTKSLYIAGHPFDGRVVEDTDVKDAFLPSPLPSVFRPAQSARDFTPYLFEITEADLERTELAMSRELRRQKRSVNRRGGPALPDLKDRQRTVRTQVVSKVLPGGAETVEQSGLIKISRSASGRTRRLGRADDGSDDSDGSLIDDSSPGSPVIATNITFGGTIRTRVIRGAANAAQAAMRGIMGRSATPELASLHHHETRTSARRLGGVEYREESVAERTSFMIKLKMPRERYRQWWRDWKAAKQRQAQQSQFHPQFTSSKTTTSQQGTPVPGSMGPPPSTPRSQIGQPPVQQGGSTNTHSQVRPGQYHYHRDGRVDAPNPPLPGQSGPAPPSWLTDALQALRQNYPHDSFEAAMRYMQVDHATGDPVKPGQPTPPSPTYQYLPRIRCNDCPGKLYTAEPDMPLENFEVHLRNRQHKERVEARRKGQEVNPLMNR